MFSNFQNHIQSLPASEAAAERVFSKMRALYSEQQLKLNPDTLRSMLIIAVDQWIKTNKIFEADKYDEKRRDEDSPYKNAGDSTNGMGLSSESESEKHSLLSDPFYKL